MKQFDVVRDLNKYKPSCPAAYKRAIEYVRTVNAMNEQDAVKIAGKKDNINPFYLKIK